MRPRGFVMWLFFALAAWSLVACTPVPAPTPPPGPDADDEPDGAAAATCAMVCKHEAALGCPAARPTAKGAPCVEVCENRIDAGVPALKPNLRCKMKATSCAAVDACDR